MSDASRAQSVEAALGANDVGAKAVVQALLIAEEREFGLADDAVLAEAITKAVCTAARGRSHVSGRGRRRLRV